MNELERFKEKFTTEADGCWRWTGSRGQNGYGRFFFHGGLQLAHRAAYTMFCGEIPEGRVIDHLCGNRGCVNPSHLEAVTQRENVLRGNGPETTRRLRQMQTHCKRGHPFSGNNLAIRDGRRACRECERAKALAHYYKNHEANKANGRDRKRTAYQAANARAD